MSMRSGPSPRYSTVSTKAAVHVRSWRASLLGVSYFAVHRTCAARVSLIWRHDRQPQRGVPTKRTNTVLHSIIRLFGRHARECAARRIGFEVPERRVVPVQVQAHCLDDGVQAWRTDPT